MYTVIKSTFRKYGYSLHSDKEIPYLFDKHNWGWYKYKKDAIKVCQSLNKLEG